MKLEKNITESEVEELSKIPTNQYLKHVSINGKLIKVESKDPNIINFVKSKGLIEKK